MSYPSVDKKPAVVKQYVGEKTSVGWLARATIDFCCNKCIVSRSKISAATRTRLWLFSLLPLDEPVASRAVFVTVSRPDRRKRYWSKLTNSKR